MKIHSCACCWARRKPNPGLECQGPSAWRGFMQIGDGKLIQITRLLWPAPQPAEEGPAPPLGHQLQVSSGSRGEGMRTNLLGGPASLTFLVPGACVTSVCASWETLLSANRSKFYVCYPWGSLKGGGDRLTVFPGGDEQAPGSDSGLRVVGSEAGHLTATWP